MTLIKGKKVKKTIGLEKKVILGYYIKSEV